MNFHPIDIKYDVPYPVGSDIYTAKQIVKLMACEFRKIYPDKREIYVLMRGSSGAIMATLLATELPEYCLHLVPVRKPGENAHSYMSAKEISSDSTVVIIDDFMSSGSTLNNIHATYPNTTIDTLILSGTVHMPNLHFKLNNVIAGYLNEELDDE